jgi:hypothetical protein
MPFSMRTSASRAAGIKASARGVGSMPREVRTKSGSPKYSRRRPSAVLTRGWLTPRRSAARLTLRVSSMATR